MKSGLRDQKGYDEHERGRLLLWSAVLRDENLRALREELLEHQRLSLESTKKLFDYLVGIPRERADAYVEWKLVNLAQHLPTIESVAMARLEPGLADSSGRSLKIRGGLLLP